MDSVTTARKKYLHKYKSSELYFRDIDAYARITPEREQELAKKVQEEEDESALFELVASNLKLVIVIAKEYDYNGLPIEDLIAEGNAALMTAAKKYKPGTGAKFSTYAAWWIHQRLRRVSMTYSDLFHIPVGFRDAVKKGEKEAHNNNELTGWETAEEERAIVNRHMEHAYKDICTHRRNKILLEDLETYHSSNLTDHVRRARQTMAFNSNFREITIDSHAVAQLIRKEQELYAVDLVGKLVEREMRALRLRYGLDDDCPRTLEEVSQIMNITRERVRQITEEALTKLRVCLDDEHNNKLYQGAIKSRKM